MRFLQDRPNDQLVDAQSLFDSYLGIFPMTILRTVFVKELETRVGSLPLALTLFIYAEGFKPSPRLGEGLQSGSPSPKKGEGIGG